MKEIRSLEVSSKVSEVAALSPVRKELVDQQRKIGRYKGVVVDGRDIGTVVFPSAELKVFMTADTNIRVERRFAELQQLGREASKEAIKENLEHRDHIDSTREDSPLRKADDALIIDTTELNFDQQVDMIVRLAWSKIENLASV